MTKITAFAVFAMVLAAFCVMPVMAANADNDLYTSKYVATKTDYPTTGSLSGAVRCHNNLLTTGVTITDPNGIVTPVELRADGTFDINDLAPGEYVMNIADGNGGQPESSKFTIRAGFTSFLESELLGHAVSPADEPIPADVIVVERAQYGMMKTIIDRPATPGTPERNHTVTVCTPGTPAIPATPATGVRGDGPGHVHADYLGHGNAQIDFYYRGIPMHITGDKHDDSYIVTPGTPAVPAGAPVCRTVIIVDCPAIPALPELSHVVGSYVDVTDELQTAIDGGARTMVFNNAMNPGGIVNAEQTAVLVPITDPAPGLVKSVNIIVSVNGIVSTIDTMEYETITI